MKKLDFDDINKKMNRIETSIHLFAVLVIVIGITLLNVSCTQESSASHYKTYNVHPDTQGYIDAFVSAGKINNTMLYIDDLNVYFHENSYFNEREIARCSKCRDNGCTPTIHIRSSFWNSKSTSILNKREVMFHELGHCILGLNHNNRKDATGYPVSVMHQTHIGDNLYNESTIESYDTELFTGHNPTDFTVNVKHRKETN